MRKTFSPISALMIGILALTFGFQSAYADETIKICINDTAKASMHFDVHFKDGGKTMKMDSGPFEEGEKCLDIPVGSTDLELNVYKKQFIIWAKVCTNSWEALPTEGVRGELAESSDGIECAGI